MPTESDRPIIPPTLAAAAAAVRAGTCSPVALVEDALARVARFQDLNTIAFLDADRALAEARVLEREARSGPIRGPLHGVPITVKDLFNVRGMPTKAGANAPLPPIEPDEAIAVTRLREAGAIILAKTNMQEIALGLNGENPWTGDVKNPHDPAHQAGGSSSGSAAATAIGIGYGSLGSDTAGSIRLPASFCGVVGFKPSFGAVSLEGALALIPSCDHAGPITRTVADAATMFAVLSARRGAPPALWDFGDGAPRFVVPRAYLAGALTPDVRAAFEAFVARLEAVGASVADVMLDIGNAGEAFLPLRAESVMVHRRALETQPEAFAPGVREALMRGYQFSAVQYLEAKQRQGEMRAALHRALQDADALLMPSAPCVAPLRGTVEIGLESGAKNLRQAILHLTAPAAFAGVPALSLPFAQCDGLPVGVQVITPFGEDERALHVGAWIERALVE
ncbi:MAG: amidase [Chloroflexi bacterium]|jgi:aspartyl-tRNA(Asn)/glutamyl-tRNA(Gln) amidotransferase subunit A|uniref:Amidase n=1 Tax=Candidatus Thermofonsia Clade 3 bacterium TaxID=2364212 RepID=A0A2M8QBB5_9CHLR|nr:amidase [Candidatus Roseilinea sp. NK_OTU-006]PJF47085.1 MAG: amidase [Candidatus Thermofonsia Clade 3 bacterium]RMG63311.1 MAG: amidase [Chloroflexota bacterium]